MRSRLVIEMTMPLTAGFDSTQRNAAWAKVAPPLSYGRMSFRRAPINVFMVSTPTRLSAALRRTRGSSGCTAIVLMCRISCW